jgi:hypothetical protein
MAGRSRIAAVTRRIRPSSNPARPGSGAAPPCGITRSGATEAGAGADLPSAAADVEEAPGHAPSRAEFRGTSEAGTTASLRDFGSRGNASIGGAVRSAVPGARMEGAGAGRFSADPPDET